MSSQRNEPLPKIPYFTLNTGYSIPVTGLPTCRVNLQNHGDGEEQTMAKALKWALQKGWTHVDCAQVDANLKTVGAVVKSAIDEGLVKRSELFITCKVWNTHHSTARCHEAVDEILRDLQLDYLDLMLIHWPHGYAEDHQNCDEDNVQQAEISRFFPKKDGKIIYSEVTYLETWKALEDDVEKGKIRSIGLANFNKVQIQDVLYHSRIKPAVVQLELTPYLSQADIREYCRKHEILVAGYSQFICHHGGRYSTRLYEDPVLLKIRRVVEKRIGQVIMRWYFQSGIVSLPLIYDRLEASENRRSALFELSSDQMKAIDGIDKGERQWPSNPKDYDHPLWPFDACQEYPKPVFDENFFHSVPNPTVQLNSGFNIPKIGFATWRDFRKLNAEGWKPENVFRASKWALLHGYRHFDCAFVDMNQKYIGKALSTVCKFETARRETIFVTSKIWNTFHSAQKCEEAILRCTRQLKLDYIDLMLIHWPHGFVEQHEAVISDKKDLEYTELCEMFPNDGKQFLLSDIDFLETWRVMERAVDQGEIRSIGVANFDLEQLKRLWKEARIKPAVLQTSVSPYYPNEELREYCNQKGIVVAAHDPLGGDITEDPVILEIARVIGKTPEQVVLRWLIERDVVVLPKTYDSDKLVQNLEIFDFELTPRQSDAMNALKRDDEKIRSQQPDWPFDTKVVQTRQVRVPRMGRFPVISLVTWGQSGCNSIQSEDIEKALSLGFYSFECWHSDSDMRRVCGVLQRLNGVSIKVARCSVTVRIWPSYRSVNDYRKKVNSLKEVVQTCDRRLVLQWPRSNEARLLHGGLDNLSYLTAWSICEERDSRKWFDEVGLGDCTIEQLKDVLDFATILPKFIQVEISPYHQQQDLRQLCLDNDIAVFGHSAFGGGVLDDPIILDISRDIGKSPEQVILRWYHEHGITTMVESFREDDLLDIHDVFTFKLTAEQIKSIDNLEKGRSSWSSDLVLQSAERRHFWTLPQGQMLSVDLNTGYKMPMLSLATWRVESDNSCEQSEEFKAAKTAVDLGCRHIEHAAVDVNWNVVAHGTRRNNKFVTRSELFHTVKIWNTAHSTLKCTEVLNEMLRIMRLTYIDLVLIHWPQGYEEGGRLFPGRYSNVDYLETWKALEAAVKSGKIRSIGLSNFNKSQIQRVLDHAEIRPAVLQIEMNPYLKQEKLREFCRQNDIAVIGYAPFGGSPDSVGTPEMWEDPVILEISRQVRKTPLQVILRWFIEHRVAVSWKFFKTSEAKESLQIFDFQLTPQQIEQIDSLDKGLRRWNYRIRDEEHPHWPFHEEF